MSVKRFIRKHIDRDSPLFQVLHRFYRWLVGILYLIARRVLPLDEHLVVFDAFPGRQYTCSP